MTATRPIPARHRRLGRRSARRGFSLLEVLVTIMLMAIVIPAAMSAISSVQQAGELARRRSEATSLAERKMNDLIATKGWKTGTPSGSFDDLPDYQWACVVDNWTQESVYQVSVIVTWTTGRRGQDQVVVSTLAYENTAEAQTGQIGGGR